MNRAGPLSIRDRYLNVLEKIAKAASGCGRSSDSIQLVVVSKSQPLETLRAAIDAGIRTFGENYVEEAVEKVAALKETGVEWHMVGHVQSRKAGPVAANFAVVHSVDGLKLAERLDRFCGEIQRELPVLLEVNVSGEESKFGFPAWDERKWSDLESDIGNILDLKHLHVLGLMTMPPFYDDAERTRPFFVRLRNLQDFLMKNFPKADWKDLSMGTSVDFIAAIQEGATFVRIGQAIFGPRHY
jgi:PLP dependent protein